MFRSLFILLMLSMFMLPSHAAIKGGVSYRIPVYYTNLDEEELNTKAEYYYDLVLKSPSKKLDDNMTAALNIYAVFAQASFPSIIFIVFI